MQDRKQFFRTRQLQLLQPADTHTLRHQIHNRAWPAQPKYCQDFIRSPNLASAPWCEVARALNYYISLIPWRKDCLHYLTSITSPLCLQLSKRQEHSTLPQPRLFDSSCLLLSSICCNLSHNPIKFNGLLRMRNQGTEQSLFYLMVLPTKLNNVTALHKTRVWIDDTSGNCIFLW